MKTPKKSRNRRNNRLIASLTPGPGPDRRRWLTRFCERLPEFAGQLGWTAAEARERAGTIRTQFMKTPNATSTP
jgi:hypothetical protein